MRQSRWMMLATSVATLAMVATLAAAQSPAPLPAPAVDTALLAAATAAAERGGSGAYPALMLVEPSLTTHTVYRPRDLAASGEAKLPIVAWANGACVNIGNRFRYFLTEIASHGYLAIATGPIGPAAVEGNGPLPQRAPTDPAAAPLPPGATPLDGPQETSAAQLIDAVNWAIAENSREGSPYYQRLATTKIAVMGQSCGGLQAIKAAADPRVLTTGVWNSGTFPADRTPRFAEATKADLARLHGPAIYVSGDASDQAFPNANDDFAALTQIPVFRAWEHGVPHAGTYRQPGGGDFAPVAVAWLDWQLKGDARAARLFRGKDCGLCTNPKWSVQKKLID